MKKKYKNKLYIKDENDITRAWRLMSKDQIRRDKEENEIIAVWIAFLILITLIFWFIYRFFNSL